MNILTWLHDVYIKSWLTWWFLTTPSFLSRPSGSGYSSEISTNFRQCFAHGLESVTATLNPSASSSYSESSTKHGTPSQQPPHQRSSSRTTSGASDYPSGTYPPRASSASQNSAGSGAQGSTSFVTSGGATLSRLHMLQQGPTPQESIKRQTLSARGLSDKEFTKHCRGFDSQIKVRNALPNTVCPSPPQPSHDCPNHFPFLWINREERDRLLPFDQ